MENKTNKPHLYFSNNKVNAEKGDFIAWKVHVGGGSKKTEEEEEKAKDYSSIKSHFVHSLDSMNRTYQYRYNKANIETRSNLKIEPKIYLKLNTFRKEKLTGCNNFFKSLGMNLVNFDNTMSEYTVSITLKEYEKFTTLLENFISRKDVEKFIGKENLLKVFLDFRLLGSVDRIEQYFDYQSESGFLYIEAFDLPSLTNIKESLLILNSSLEINTENNKLIIKSGILQEKDIEIINNCFDSVKKITASNMKFSVFPNGEIVEKKPNFNVVPSSVSETICIVDSGIEQIDNIKDYISYDSNINISHIGKNPLEDSKVSSNGHGTNVAGIAMYGKQIHNNEKDITPLCRVCSLQIIDSTEETSIDFLQTINDIKRIHIESNREIKIFNLSVSTETLSKNIISNFAFYLDNLMHENDILCVICTGNNDDCEKLDYPMSWTTDDSFITSPAEAINGITVGSIGHPQLGDNYASYYTRKDNIQYPQNYSDRTKKYRRKPDILIFGGNKDDEFRSLGPNGNIVELYGTSFAAPYVTHLLLILKKIYQDISINSLKALLLNRTIKKIYDPSIYAMFKGIDHDRLHGHGTILDEEINNGSFALSSDNKVTIIIESEFDFSTYSHQHYPFLTTTIKMPKLKEQKGKHVKVKASLCYNPLVNSTGKLGDYNTCFIGFKLHFGSDSLEHRKYKEGDTVTELTGLSGERWSGTPWNNAFWNNTQIESFTLSKNKYNKLIEDDLAITIKAILKKDDLVLEHYKDKKQAFSLVITVEDESKEGVLYDYIKTENSLNTVVENKAEIKASLKTVI